MASTASRFTTVYGLEKADGKERILVFLLAITLGGTLPFLSTLYQPLTWGVWGVMAFLGFLYARKRNLAPLIKPALPYLLWLIGYVAWGWIVAPVSVVRECVTLLVTTAILFLATAIVTSKRDSLRRYAEAAQWVIFLNFLMLPLASVSPRASAIIDMITDSQEVAQSELFRFSGFWGNPNMAGYVCLIAIVLSVWARPTVAWIGRISAVLMIYFTVSRKSMILLLAMLLLNLIFVQRYNLRRMFLMVAAAVAAVFLFALSDALLHETQTRMSSSRIVTRLLDVTERDTAEAGGETRAELLQEWLPAAAAAPWYGYGYGAMAGAGEEGGSVSSGWLPQLGTHNTYLGLILEIGPIGLVAFLGVLFVYGRRYLKARGTPEVRWALFSLFVCNVLILTVSHSHLVSFVGIAAFALFFLLPTCPALVEQGRLKSSGRRI